MKHLQIWVALQFAQWAGTWILDFGAMLWSLGFPLTVYSCTYWRHFAISNEWAWDFTTKMCPFTYIHMCTMPTPSLELLRPWHQIWLDSAVRVIFSQCNWYQIWLNEQYKLLYSVTQTESNMFTGSTYLWYYYTSSSEILGVAHVCNIHNQILHLSWGVCTDPGPPFTNWLNRS
jgi:hypothetical protein